MSMTTLEIRHAHLFCGIGGGAKGFNAGHARVGRLQARFRCLGGIDVDAAAVRDFGRMTGVRGTVLDLFDREQYIAFHGQEPRADWREATAVDIQKAFGWERPHIVFLSAPCKGFSGLLSNRKSHSTKYQALNGLALRGITLLLRAYADDLPELILFENVPLIASRGRHLIDHICALLRASGYAVSETAHDCGKLGGLAQIRKRFLLVARHTEKVPSFLYEPVKRPLRAVGDVLGRMLLPGSPMAGPMHKVPSLQWKTWVRLAFVEAGSDWRSLNRLAVENGYLRDYGIVPEKIHHNGILGVVPWDKPSGTVTGRSMPTTGNFAIADPRNLGKIYGKYAITAYDSPGGSVIAGSTTGQGAYAVADPRPNPTFSGKYGVADYKNPAVTVLSNSNSGQSAYAVADPRFQCIHHNNVFRIIPFDESSVTVTCGHGPSAGGLAVADPRCAGWEREKTGYSREGAYGIIGWNETARPIVASGSFDNSRFSVADPRLPELNQNLSCVIRALDGTWHRPFTTLELAALQGLIDPEEQLELDGLSNSAWRERIGNAVPPPAAEAIAGVMGQVLLLTWSGQTFALGSTPIWVQPMVAGLMAARSRDTDLAAQGG
jgi:site-specific DNA-cytosine methylase